MQHDRVNSASEDQPLEGFDASACFTSVVMKNRTGVLVLDPDGRILFANPAAQNAVGSTLEALLNRHLDIPIAGERTEIQIRRPDGSMGTAELTASTTEWNGTAAHLVMLYDVTERKAVENEIRRLAARDTLTGLPNRAAFQRHLADAIRRCGGSGRGLAVLFMDLDRFKEVNDSLGHHAGDELLRSLAERLPRRIRSTDMVARLGGDEFVFLLESVTAPEVAADVARKLLAETMMPISIGGQNVGIGASIGIALFPEHGQDVETLMQRADVAMYAAKRDPLVSIRCFSSEHAVAGPDLLDLRLSLRGALEKDEFLLHFQPQFNVVTKDLVGMEALLRWRSPEWGLVSPTRFVPELEATGQISEVGRWVLDEVCRVVTDWKRDGRTVAPVAVNVSPLQLSSPAFANTVLRTISDRGLEPGELALELTESGVIQDLDRAEDVLGELKRAGIGLHLDDFGTGYSSLNVLRRLPVDTLKIDRSFVADSLMNPRSRSLAGSIVRLSHDLSMRCIAEGVETLSQLDFLRSCGCDTVQGFLTGRPLPALEMADLLDPPYGVDHFFSRREP